jgi:hypothetical protein
LTRHYPDACHSMARRWLLAVMQAPTQLSEAQPARLRRRWVRYSLSTLLGADEVLCVVLGLWVRQAAAGIRFAVEFLRPCGKIAPMLNNPRRAKGGGWAVLALGLVIVLPVLYVASIGPAWGLYCRGVIEAETYDAIYAPVLYVTRRFELAGDVLEAWWCGLWEP